MAKRTFRNPIGRPARGAVRRDPWGNKLPPGVSWRAGSADGLYVAWIGSGASRTYVGSRAASGGIGGRKAAIAELADMVEVACR